MSLAFPLTRSLARPLTRPLTGERRGGGVPVITGFAYPANTLTSTVAGQWSVGGVPVPGETGTSFVVPVLAIGQTVQCGDSNVLTVWHPDDIAAVKSVRIGQRMFGSVSPDVEAAVGSPVRQWEDIVNGYEANQADAANQPIRRTGAGGYDYLEFDSANDVLEITGTASRDIFRAVTYGGIIAAVRSRNPTGGDPSPNPVFFATSSNVTRLGLYTRLGGANTFAAGGRRTDAGSFTSASSPNNGDWNVLTAKADWGLGAIRLRVNGTQTASANFASGAGPTANTASAAARIGAAGSLGQQPSESDIACAIFWSADADISARDLARLERFAGLLAGTPVNVPLQES